MQTDLFIERVMRHARAHDAGDAKAAAVASLQLLAEQMPAEEVRNLAPQLPNELAAVEATHPPSQVVHHEEV